MTFTAVPMGPAGAKTKRYRVLEMAGVTGTFGDIKRWAAICYPGATVKKGKAP